jgi:uncharacterized membrane protein YtjA (UPF0391 family)
LRKWALIFLVIAVITGIFGFSDVEAASATIAQWLFGISVLLFLGVGWRRHQTSTLAVSALSWMN